jgi:hypothetical protein
LTKSYAKHLSDFDKLRAALELHELVSLCRVFIGCCAKLLRRYPSFWILVLVQNSTIRRSNDEILSVSRDGWGTRARILVVSACREILVF